MQNEAMTDEEAHQKLQASGCTPEQIDLMLRYYDALRAEGEEPGRALGKVALAALRPAMDRFVLERLGKVVAAPAPGVRTSERFGVWTP